MPWVQPKKDKKTKKKKKKLAIHSAASLIRPMFTAPEVWTLRNQQASPGTFVEQAKPPWKSELSRILLCPIFTDAVGK